MRLIGRIKLSVWILRLGNVELRSRTDKLGPRLIALPMAIVKKVLSAIFGDQIMTERDDKIVYVCKTVAVIKKNMEFYYVLREI
jgi:hypothetical protein